MNEKPPSVLRPSGSSTCLHRKAGEDHEKSRTNKITMIQTDELRNFSTERYYMLSEIQLKAHSLLFLQDWLDSLSSADDETQDLSLSSAGSSDDKKHGESNGDPTDPNQISYDNGLNESRDRSQTTCILPPYIILYLLWKVDDIYQNNIRGFTNHIKEVMQHLKDFHESKCQHPHSSGELFPPIYLAIDRVVTPKPYHQSEEEFKREQIKIAEMTVRTITSNEDLGLRDSFEGVVVGLSGDYRAAPALESCCDAILIGDAERRHFPRKRKLDTTIVKNDGEANPLKSSIGIVTEYPEDLIGVEPDFDTESVQGIDLHSRTCGNWSDKGNLMDFGLRAHKLWRKQWNFADVVDQQKLRFDFWKIKNSHDLDNMSSGFPLVGKRRKPENKEQARFLASDIIRNNVDHVSNVMVACFMVGLTLRYWSTLEQIIISLKGWWVKD